MVVCAIASTVPAGPVSAAPKSAVLIVDGNSGRVLFQSSADEPRYPASLTKMMTLYLVFELMEQGRLTPQTKITISPHAANAAPSKLDLDPGEQIALMDAVKVLITKSANDIAIAIAEHIAGSEDRFAALMTKKARALGMSATTFKNASGLPDEEQVTTARDMITLALHLQDDFPRFYPLFATRTFTYKDETFRNHNTLLFNYEGTDGFKTGYTRLSGFNLVASVRRGQKHVIGVVFGGSSAASRNTAMRTYLNMGLVKASTIKTRKPMLVARAKPEAAARVAAAVPAPQRIKRPPVRSAPVAEPPPAIVVPPPAAAIVPPPTVSLDPPARVAMAPSAPAAVVPPQAPASAPFPIQVARVRTVQVSAAPAPEAERPASEQEPGLSIAALLERSGVASSLTPPAGEIVPASASAPAVEREPVADVPPPPPARMAAFAAAASGAAPISMPRPTPAAAAQDDRPAPALAEPASRGAPPSTLGQQANNLARGEPALLIPPLPVTRRPEPAAYVPAEHVAAPAAAASGFLIQIGAYQSEAEAERQLAAVRERAGGVLGSASALTQTVHQGDRTFFRARYAGFAAHTSAASACSALKRMKVDCLVVKAE